MYSLPHELLVMTFLRLPLTDILSVRVTNKYMSTLCQTELFWQKKSALDFPGHREPEQSRYIDYYKELAIEYSLLAKRFDDYHPSDSEFVKFNVIWLYDFNKLPIDAGEHDFLEDVYYHQMLKLSTLKVSCLDIIQ